MLVLLAAYAIYCQDVSVYPDKAKGDMYQCCTGFFGRHVFLTRHSQLFQLTHHILSFVSMAALIYGVRAGLLTDGGSGGGVLADEQLQ